MRASDATSRPDDIHAALAEWHATSDRSPSRTTVCEIPTPCSAPDTSRVAGVFTLHQEKAVKASHATTLNTLTRVQRFLDQNGSTLGDINASGYRKILDDVVEKLSTHAADQTTS